MDGDPFMTIVPRSSNLYRTLRRVRAEALCLMRRHRGVARTAYVHHTARVSRDLVALDYAFVGRHCDIPPGVSIGRYSMLASEVAIVGEDHRSDVVGVPIQFAGRPEQHRTHIGTDVWIGRRAILMRGVRVGDGAIVAAGAVVTRDVDPFTVVAGIPAQPLRPRFPSSDAARRHMATLASGAVEPQFAPPPSAPDLFTASTDRKAGGHSA